MGQMISWDPVSPVSGTKDGFIVCTLKVSDPIRSYKSISTVLSSIGSFSASLLLL